MILMVVELILMMVVGVGSCRIVYDGGGLREYGGDDAVNVSAVGDGPSGRKCGGDGGSYCVNGDNSDSESGEFISVDI